MKFDCVETIKEKKIRLEQWHDWFAWYPVRVGSHDGRWLETIKRQGLFDSCDRLYAWRYRAK
jgi:hypothetical protein